MRHAIQVPIVDVLLQREDSGSDVQIHAATREPPATQVSFIYEVFHIAVHAFPGKLCLRGVALHAAPRNEFLQAFHGRLLLVSAIFCE